MISIEKAERLRDLGLKPRDSIPLRIGGTLPMHKEVWAYSLSQLLEELEEREYEIEFISCRAPDGIYHGCRLLHDGFMDDELPPIKWSQSWEDAAALSLIEVIEADQ